MSTSLTTLTIGVVPVCEMLLLLTKYIDKQHIAHCSLLGQMQREDVMVEYGASPGDELSLTLFNGHQLARVSRQKVERLPQSIVEVLDNQGFGVILLMSTASVTCLTARNNILLGPIRIIPPLVISTVEGHQVGVIVLAAELSKAQTQKWQVL